MVASSNRPKTPTGSSPHSKPVPSIPDSKSKTQHPPRRSSLGQLLKRSKSGEAMRSSSGKLSKKQMALHQQQELARQEREAAAISKSPPRLPDIYNGAPPPVLRTFGGENARPDSVDIVSNKAGGY